MDKSVQKHFLRSAAPEIPLAPWIDVDASNFDGQNLLERVQADLGFPCFVKPANMGSSVGVSKVNTDNELQAALTEAAQHDNKLVIERGINAREVEIAVLGGGGSNTLVSECGEIILPKDTWYDYDNKYTNDIAKIAIPADIPATLAQRIQALGRLAFIKTGCRGLARIDFFVDRQTGVPYLNELNTMPGFTSVSMYPKLIAHAGITYSDLITRLCELGLSRTRELN